MITTYFPEIASISYTGTGLPLSDAPIRSALNWRLERIFTYLPWLRRRQRKHSTFSRFGEGIIQQRAYFSRRQDALRELAPPLDFEKSLERYQALISGQQSPVGHACAFLPPALFVRELRQRRENARTVATTGAEAEQQ